MPIRSCSFVCLVSGPLNRTREGNSLSANPLVSLSKFRPKTNLSLPAFAASEIARAYPSGVVRPAPTARAATLFAVSAVPGDFCLLRLLYHKLSAPAGLAVARY